MRFSNIIVGSAALAASVFASPTPNSSNNPNHNCSDIDSIIGGPYTISNDLCDASSATSGGQCVALDSVVDDTISWSAVWTWEGGQGVVKSFASAALNLPTSQQISQISFIPTSWTWNITGMDVVANTAYVITTADAHSNFEIMIWIASFGDLKPNGTQIESPLIEGTSWDLYRGQNEGTTVYSFFADSNIFNYVGDIKAFLDYLVGNQGLSGEQFVKSISAGTQALTGSDVEFTAVAFTMSLS